MTQENEQNQSDPDAGHVTVGPADLHCNEARPPEPEPWPDRPGAGLIVDALLKQPTRLFSEIGRTSPRQLTCSFVCITVLSLALYGLTLGTFAWGNQLWAAPLKVIATGVLGAIVCLPRLYILSALAGYRLSMQQVTGLLTAALALIGVLLTGFAPICIVFSLSTGSIGFMGAVHLAVAAIGLTFGLRFLLAGFAALGSTQFGALSVWCTVFCCVILQIATSLRPLIGPWSGFFTTDKRFFTQHWIDPDSWDELDEARSRAKAANDVDLPR